MVCLLMLLAAVLRRCSGCLMMMMMMMIRILRTYLQRSMMQQKAELFMLMPMAVAKSNKMLTMAAVMSQGLQWGKVKNQLADS